MHRTFAIASNCPNPSLPSVLVFIWLRDLVGDLAPCEVNEAIWEDTPERSQLWIPALDAWTLDTVRMVWSELQAYAPIDRDARAGVTRHTTRGGKLREYEFWIEARGWRVSISTGRNERLTDVDGQAVFGNFETGEWSEPMATALLELSAKGPLPLHQIAEVLPGSPADFPANSRIGLQRGLNAPIDLKGWRRRAEFCRMNRLRHSQLRQSER